jgi:hypothetical protein
MEQSPIPPLEHAHTLSNSDDIPTTGMAALTAMQQVEARMIALRRWIEAGESSIAQLNSTRASMPDAVFQERNSRMRAEVLEKKTMYHRLNQFANAHRGNPNSAMLGGYVSIVILP